MATLGIRELVTTDVARGLRVLIVDAERDSANAFLRQVQSLGHGGHAATDYPAALRVAAAWQPDVVLLDMDTPVMDAVQVAKRLRSDSLSEDCLIIAFAPSVDDARREPCIEAGIDLLLSKPVDQDVVETLLTLECVRVNRRSNSSRHHRDCGFQPQPAVTGAVSFNRPIAEGKSTGQ